MWAKLGTTSAFLLLVPLFSCQQRNTSHEAGIAVNLGLNIVRHMMEAGCLMWRDRLAEKISPLGVRDLALSDSHWVVNQICITQNYEQWNSNISSVHGPLTVMNGETPYA